MWKVLLRARDRFGRDQRGNLGVLFAFSAIPLIGLLGGAVDMTRYTRHKTQILNSMDAAAVALVKTGAKDDAGADRFVNDYIAAMRPLNNGDSMLHMQPFDAIEIPGGYRIVSDGILETAFLGLVGIDEMSLDLQSEVMRTGGKYEIALALDNTGSMDAHGRIEALRRAANQLVDDLYKEEGTDKRVRMALVPFVTAVNIKTEGVYDEASWIAPYGKLGVNFTSADGKPVNRLELFDKMHVPFKGCVEAREDGYDEEDTAPTSSATRWVPYLWPDEPDSGYSNSYLTDSGSGPDWNRLTDVEKYDVALSRKPKDRTSLGPNAACPRAIVELTNVTKRLHDEIDLMQPHNPGNLPNNSGTNVAEGLAWAWRVLSPGEPFSQGADYDDEETTKVLVLLSDGRNQIVASRDDPRATKSDYTSYGYLAAGRLGASQGAAERAVDAKVARICEKVKLAGIRVYTILFEVDFLTTQEIFRECASTGDDGEALYYYVPDQRALETAFETIGEDIMSIRVTR